MFSQQNPICLQKNLLEEFNFQTPNSGGFRLKLIPSFRLDLEWNIDYAISHLCPPVYKSMHALCVLCVLIYITGNVSNHYEAHWLIL